MRAGSKLLLLISLAAAIVGCGSGDKPTADSTTGSSTTTSGGDSGGGKPLVFFSQANSGDPWRQVFDAETKAAAEAQKSTFDFEMQTAADDASKQIGQLETAMVKNPKVLLVSPVDDTLEKAVADAKAQGAFVVLLDRSVKGDKYDVHIGGDNTAIGFQAGQYMAQKLNGKGTILMIKGLPANSAASEREKGFMDAIGKAPGIKVIQGNNCDFQRQKAMTYMENFLQTGQAFDAVYAHNDEMAIGAYLAMKAANTPKKMIVGIDACQKEVIDMIKEGKLDATFTYPDPGPKGIEVATNFIHGQQPAAKKIVLATQMVTKENADAYLTAHPSLAK